MDGSVRSWRYAPNASVNQSYLPHRWCAIFQPLCELTHIPTRLIFFSASDQKKKKPTLKRLTKWFAALDLSFNKVFDPFMCGRFFFSPSPPSLIGPQPVGRLPLFASCFEFEFWWPAFNTWHQLVSQTYRAMWNSQRPAYCFFFFVWQKKGTSERQRRKSRGLISNYLIYMKINPRASSTQRD